MIILMVHTEKFMEIIESDAKKGRFIVSEYGSTGENKEKNL